MAADRKDPPDRYDRLIKAILTKFSADLATWLLGDSARDVRAVDPNLAVTAKRFADKLLHVKREGKPPVLLHVEFQTSGTPTMPLRLAEYMSLLLGRLESHDLRGSELACVVVYLDQRTYKEDPGSFRYDGPCATKLHLEYKVVRLWELDPAPFLEMESPGLCPFVPLMRGNAERLVIESHRKIVSAPLSWDVKGELLTSLGILADRVITDRTLIRRLYSELRDMGENYFIDLILEDGIRQGRKEGRKEGREEARHAMSRAILRILTTRFGEIPAELSERIGNIASLEELDELLAAAAVCSDLPSFTERL